MPFSGYSIVIAQTVASLGINKGKLQITTAISLSSVKMKSNQMYGVIGRTENDIGANDLLHFKPAPMVLQSPASKTSRNWLSVDRNKLMVIFLIHSKDKDIFDRQVLFFAIYVKI